jgi:hypothetical protein
MAAEGRRIRFLGRLGAPAAGFAVACLLAALVTCVLVGTTVVLHPARAAVGRNPASDYQIMTWSLAWWPWAVQHGADPFYTHLLWAPGGFSTLWMTTIPAASLIALPLTFAAGPLVAFNVLMILAVVLATGAGYLLCHELTDRVLPSLLGGLVFGLSPYMLGHTLSQHLNLALVFPIPLLAWLVVRYVRGRTTARRLVAGFAALLLVLLGSSLELFVDFTLLSILVLAVAIVGGGSQRKIFRHAGALVAAAYAVCLPVLLPLAVFALTAAHAPLRSSPSNYAADLLNIVVPTPTLLLGGADAACTVSQHFVGNIGERDAYLGIPLLAISAGAVRASWRRGAWIAGALLLGALLLSFGPTLTAGGRPIVGIPFSLARLPVLRNALPVRLSVFTALAAACLCAIWFARPHRRGVGPLAAALVVASLFPNFWTGSRLPGAWAVTDAFAWSTPHVPRGFATQGWRTVVRPGSNVLVLPTGDHSAASYWQVATGMGFTLATPATPFVPPELAAEPTVARLADDVLPELDGPVLGGARLRAFLLARRIETVVVTHAARRHWSRLVGKATGTAPISLNGVLVYRVPPGLAPRPGWGAVARAHSRGRYSVVAWLHYDGQRAHVRARLRTGGVGGRVATLSAPAGDAEATAAAVNARGRAAVAFTEWRAHRLLLRVASYSGSRWHVSTLDERTEPIWSPNLVVTPNGTTIATWIDQANPSREVRVAVLPLNGRWQHPVRLDAGEGLGSIGVAPGRNDLAVLAWHDSRASEERVLAALYDRGSWSHPVTLTAGLERIDHVAVGRQGTFVRWFRRRPGGRIEVFEARRHGSSWTRAVVSRRARRTPARPGAQ